MLFALKKILGFWLMPLPLCSAAMLLGVLLVLMRRQVRLGRALVVGGLLVLVVLSNKSLSRALIRPLEVQYPPIPELAGNRPPAALTDCRYVMVMGAGNGFTPDAAALHLLSASGLARVTEAVRLLQAFPEARLIVSGPAAAGGMSHATVLARAAMSLGIESGRVLTIDHARDTEEEALAVKRIAGGAPVAVVTSAWHMPRTMALFRHAGVTAVACPTDFRSHAEDSFTWDDLLWDVGGLERSTLAVHERLGYLWIWLRGRA